MKLKTYLINKKTIFNTLSLSKDKTRRKNILKVDISKNLKNRLSLVLKKEREKANSTTQTGQKSMIYSNEENSNHFISPKVFYNSLNNNEKKKNLFKKNSKLFLLNDKLYSRNEINGKLFFLYKKAKKKANDINSKTNNIKTNKLNKLSLIDVCYNSFIDNYKKDKCYSFNNNLDMYHYYDTNQRRIEKIIPKINEYLNNNLNKKKFVKKKIFKFKKNNNNIFQHTFNNFAHEYKKNKNKNNKYDEEKKNDINFCLYNALNDTKMTNNNKNKRDFSCKVSNKKRKYLFEFEKMNLNYGNKDKKFRIGILNYLSTPNELN